MDELEFSEAESNMIDLISEYQQYQSSENSSDLRDYAPSVSSEVSRIEPVKKMSSLESPARSELNGPRTAFRAATRENNPSAR